MKIATVLGTRPEIIRLSLIIPKLDRHAEHILIHTGQNAAASLSDVFFTELRLRPPDHFLGIVESDFARQIGSIMSKCHDIFVSERPDRLLILGDTNSALSAFVAKRLGISVLHMEAGNRCFDPRVPEEVNRRVVDHASDVLLPYTERSRQNLLREGFAADRVYVTGNPIYEVIQANKALIERSPVLDRIGLSRKKYLLVTLHRAENVDLPDRLNRFAQAFRVLARDLQMPVIVSTHPRTRARLTANHLAETEDVRFLDPFGFADFAALEKAAACVLTDSGTVQEECAILHVPNVTLRDVTERPETLECGSNMLTGDGLDAIVAAVKLSIESPPRWTAPAEYLTPAVSDTIVRIATGYIHGLRPLSESLA